MKLGKATSVVVLVVGMATPASAGLADLAESFELYGSFRGHVAGYGGDSEIQDNSSRVGIRFSRAVSPRLRVLAGVEASVNLFDSDSSFNVEESTDTGFGTIDRTDAGDVFGTRLGYVGVDLASGGRLTIGKQWSAYYDVSGWTDEFDVFGGEGGFTYTANTDGGTLGTGRAEKALLYRNDLGKLQIGAQVQLSESGDDVATDPGGALSLRYRLTKHLRVGAAYNSASLNIPTADLVPGLTDDPEYIVLGVRLETERLKLAAIWAEQENGDFAFVTDPAAIAPVSIVYDGSGIELYGRYRLNDRLHLTGGMNTMDPDRLDPRIDPDFERKYYVLGARWHFDDHTFVYLEARLDDSVDPAGEPGEDVVTVGLRYDFSMKKAMPDEDR